MERKREDEKLRNIGSQINWKNLSVYINDYNLKVNMEEGWKF